MIVCTETISFAYQFRKSPLVSNSMIFAVLITIPSNGQTLSTWSVFIIPDSVIIFRLWLAHWVQILCLATRLSCSSLASSWPIRPRVWNLNRSVIPDLLAIASTMLWRGTKSKFYPLDLYIYIYFFFFLLSWFQRQSSHLYKWLCPFGHGVWFLCR